LLPVQAAQRPALSLGSIRIIRLFRIRAKDAGATGGRVHGASVHQLPERQRALRQWPALALHPPAAGNFASLGVHRRAGGLSDDVNRCAHWPGIGATRPCRWGSFVSFISSQVKPLASHWEQPRRGNRGSKVFDFDLIDRYGVKFFFLQNPKIHASNAKNPSPGIVLHNCKCWRCEPSKRPGKGIGWVNS
jgi:hypothetical protein